jgi:hypothetical protein
MRQLYHEGYDVPRVSIELNHASGDHQIVDGCSSRDASKEDSELSPASQPSDHRIPDEGSSHDVPKVDIELSPASKPCYHWIPDECLQCVLFPFLEWDDLARLASSCKYVRNCVYQEGHSGVDWIKFAFSRLSSLGITRGIASILQDSHSDDELLKAVWNIKSQSVHKPLLPHPRMALYTYFHADVACIDSDSDDDTDDEDTDDDTDGDADTDTDGELDEHVGIGGPDEIDDSDDLDDDSEPGDDIEDEVSDDPSDLDEAGSEAVSTTNIFRYLNQCLNDKPPADQIKFTLHEDKVFSAARVKLAQNTLPIILRWLHDQLGTTSNRSEKLLMLIIARILDSQLVTPGATMAYHEFINIKHDDGVFCNAMQRPDSIMMYLQCVIPYQLGLLPDGCKNVSECGLTDKLVDAFNCLSETFKQSHSNGMPTGTCFKYQKSRSNQYAIKTLTNRQLTTLANRCKAQNAMRVISQI